MIKKKYLYLVSVPIGNFDDFTIRGIETLKNADIIIGEERATTEKILKKLGIFNKEILLLNEHNESKEALDIFHNIINNNLSAALISEAGTPCIADPGTILVNIFHQNKLPVVPVPGVSSIITAIMVSGITTDSFKYIGFLSSNSETRLKELKSLSKEKIPIVFLETPYRKKQVLNDISIVYGKNKIIVFAYKLTQPEEIVIKDTVFNVIEQTKDFKKGEFVIVIL